MRTIKCMLCSQSYPLYRYDAFKSKSVEQRREFVSKKNICFNCVNSRDYLAKSCTSTNRCKVPGCGKPHHSLLHQSNLSLSRPDHRSHLTEGTSTPAIPTGSLSDPSEPTASVNTSVAQSPEIFLQVIPLKVIGKNGRHTTTYALIDSASDVTLIDPSLVQELGIEGEEGELSISTVSQREKQQTGLRVDFKISSVDGQRSDYVIVRNAWALRDLTIPLKHISAGMKATLWTYLQHVPFPDVERGMVSILIGTDIQEAFIPLEVRRGKPNEPFAIRSCLGWSVLGGSVGAASKHLFNLNFVSAEDTSLSRQLEEFWRVESCGTLKETRCIMSVEDHKALKIINNTISFADGHYQMGLLWKHEDPHLPFNRSLAETRLKALKGRFRRSPELEMKYRSVVNDYIAKGYARQLSKEEASPKCNITWYLPHHPVFNINKPNKIRVVFDAAAKFKGTSLNDRLYHGPDLTNDLVGVLIRFRQEKIAFTADIEAMFHQVKVLPKDADALRFLWWNDSLDQPPVDYQMLVHIFGATSSPCCANKALKQTAEDNKTRLSPEAVKTIQTNFYVDDLLKSVATTDSAITLANQLVRVLKECGFRLTKFTSNSNKVLRVFPQEEVANPSINLDLDELPIGRTLGLHWDALADNLQFKVAPTNKPPTKRGILSPVSSLFDPLGFLGPFLLPAKVILQQLWRIDASWDDPIQEPLLAQWNNWLNSMSHVANLKIPRCFKSFSERSISNTQMHYFSDASTHGYAAVGYLRLLDDVGEVHCAFVMGKTRNTPLKQWSVPRLELQATVIATRLHLLIREELDLPLVGVTFWSDSLTTLQYIANERRRFKPFLANRVNEIREVSTPQQWRYVPTSLNPADDGSRGMELHKLNSKCRWLCGPSFLLRPEEEWPSLSIGSVSEHDSEVQVEKSVMSIIRGSSLDKLLKRFSSWPRLLTIVAWLIRFVNYVQRNGSAVQKGGITLPEIRLSTSKVVQLVQRQTFPDELDSLSAGHPVKRQSELCTLSPVVVEGTLRVGGRIHRAPISYEAAHPMILPKKHPVSTLIIRYFHEILGHAGREHVLSCVRQHFWIIQARFLVRQVLRKCISCRRRNEAPLNQIMADLPKQRLTPYIASKISKIIGTRAWLRHHVPLNILLQIYRSLIFPYRP
ncbi:uncharacterized protein LOC114968359 [Acropora millepora]|uniref:uncharacterized protein LOC114968359 n=1 Tax=Acropora millepora TaxID=45264 RepID=UPI001CF20A18|nr:uncharacterized protein LOC114968359 [Acropora millepora]